jgi:hypothetical protein
LARLFEVLLQLKGQEGIINPGLAAERSHQQATTGDQAGAQAVNNTAATQQQSGSSPVSQLGLQPGRLLTFSVAQTSLKHVFVRLCGAAAAAGAGMGTRSGNGWQVSSVSCSSCFT